MDIDQYLDKLNMKLKVGIVDILLPSYGIKGFTIFEDLAKLFKFETNYEAELFLKKKIKEKGIKGKIDFDLESDYISISSKNGQIMLEVAILINELSNNRIDEEAINDFKKFIDKWKMPKKQKWGVGDIFTIPLSDGSYYFAQIIELIEDVTPIIVILDLKLDQIPNDKTIKAAKPIAVLSIVSDKLDNFFFKVIGNMDPLFKIPPVIRRDPIRNIQYSDLLIVDFCEAVSVNGNLDMYEDFTSNTKYLSK